MPEMPIFNRFFDMQDAKPASGAGLTHPTPSKTLPKVVLETALGEITIEIDTVRAPLTAANFLRYVEAGIYDGGAFVRTLAPANQPDHNVKVSLIHGSARKCAEAYPPVHHEPTTVTGISHLNGVISMARVRPGSATSHFFLCVGDQPQLDFAGRRNPDGEGYSAFGRLIDGWLVLKKIHMAPAEGQELTPPVQILRARRL